jgi:hypothetical protein
MSVFGFYLDEENQLIIVVRPMIFLYITKCFGNQVGILVIVWVFW